MIRSVIILVAHDLCLALKNRTLHLVLCIPLFVHVTLSLTTSSLQRPSFVTLALIQADTYPLLMLESLTVGPHRMTVRWASHPQEAARWLRERQVDGIVSQRNGVQANYDLTVIQPTSMETRCILEALAGMQDVAEQRGPDWIAAVRTAQSGSIQKQTKPLWILMMVLLVSFIVVPAQIGEEKEKQQLVGWLQTPVREEAWLVSKLTYGTLLIFTAVLALHLMDGEIPLMHGLGYLAMLCLGGFCFGSLGICLGLLCRTQASARTLGILCYLPLLMPAALADMSDHLRGWAHLIPSFYLYEPINALVLHDAGVESFIREGCILAGIGLGACLASLRLIRCRWLMS